MYSYCTVYRNIGAPEPTGREVGAGDISWVCPKTMSTVE
jgi:hypothetical protein